MDYGFDRYLRHADLTRWLHDIAETHPNLVTIEEYGRSFEGRELWLATITDSSTGAHDTKPAHWVDANIHSIEVTAGVAALHLIHHLVTGFGTDDTVTRALRTRTFYVAPRVNPDGVEWALADAPQYLRSSVRPWPWRDAHRAPGLHERDMDGDGRILTMRIPDPNGWWTPSELDPRIMKPVPPDGTAAGVPRYRLLYEGELVDHDGFTLPTPAPPEGLDMNRNFPAGWGTEVRGSGDHPMSEPEIDALVRAMTARPNICGYNAFHTSGGVLLRPSSTKPDSDLPPIDVWVWKQLGERGESLTGYTVNSVFEDFTWDKKVTMSGAADDWVYEHLGVYGWTTEFWDVIQAATGTKQSTHFWYVGPTEQEEVAVLRWAEEQGLSEMHTDWYAFDHPQLGAVELGGWDDMCSWSNPPLARLAAEVRPHAEFAVFQALAAPALEVVHTASTPLGDGHWRVEVGIANTGWLPTDVTAHARAVQLVLPVTATIDTTTGTTTGTTDGEDEMRVVGGPARIELGQLDGRVSARFRGRQDGSPDRALAAWVVRAAAGTSLQVTVAHPRAGRVRATVVLGVLGAG